MPDSSVHELTLKQASDFHVGLNEQLWQYPLTLPQLKAPSKTGRRARSNETFSRELKAVYSVGKLNKMCVSYFLILKEALISLVLLLKALLALCVRPLCVGIHSD